VISGGLRTVTVPSSFFSTAIAPSFKLTLSILNGLISPTFPITSKTISTKEPLPLKGVVPNSEIIILPDVPKFGVRLKSLVNVVFSTFTAFKILAL